MANTKKNPFVNSQGFVGTMLSPRWGNTGYRIGMSPGQPGTGRRGSSRAELPDYKSPPRGKILEF